MLQADQPQERGQGRDVLQSDEAPEYWPARDASPPDPPHMPWQDRPVAPRDPYEEARSDRPAAKRHQRQTLILGALAIGLSLMLWLIHTGVLDLNAVGAALMSRLSGVK